MFSISNQINHIRLAAGGVKDAQATEALQVIAQALKEIESAINSLESKTDSLKR